MFQNKYVATALQKGKNGFAGLFVCLALVCCAASLCSAQEALPHKLASSAVPQPVPVEFAATLNTLARRFHVAIVAEGQPQTIDETAKPPDLQSHMTPEEAVKQVADYYDYTSVRRGRVFQLTRRYTNSNDVPEVTLEECRQALAAITQQTDLFNPHFPTEDRNGSPRAHVAHLLARQQMEALGSNGLTTAQLSAEQKTEIWRVALHFFVQDEAEIVGGEGNILPSFRNLNPNFLWRDVEGIRAFGQEAFDTKTQQTVFMALSHPGIPMVTSNGVPIITVSDRTHKGAPVEVSDATAPDPNAPPLPPAVAFTLGHIVADLNHRVASKEVYAVDAAYAAKHATLAGAENVTSAEIMDALAAVYGLRVIRPEPGTLRLTHPLYAGAQDISDLGKAVRSAIPDPFWRVITIRVSIKRAGLQQGRPALLFTPRESVYSTAGSVLREAAIREFRARVESKIRKSKEQKLPLSALDEREKQLFVLIMAADSLTEACWIADRPLPPYIADFDHVVLTGGVYRTDKDEERFSLFFSYPDPATGILRKGVGFSNARIPKE